MIPATLEKRLSDCCGRSVIAACYHQIEIQDDDRTVHDIHPEIGDFCDVGVSLTLDDDSVAYVAWDGTFCQYGLMMTRTPAKEFEPEGHVFPRTEYAPLDALTGDPIISADVIWDDFDGAACPQAFHFKFASSRQLVLSAAQPMERSNGTIELFGVSDWVAILHNPRIINEHLRVLNAGG